MAAFLAQQQGQGAPPLGAAQQYPGGVSMAAAPPQAQQPQYATPPPAAAAAAAPAGAASFPSTVEQRVTMEVNSLKAMLSAIVDALQVFTSTQAPRAAQPVSMSEVCKMFNLIVDVLQQDPNIGRVRYLLFDSIPEGYPTVFSVLFSCLNANLSFAPGVHSTEETKTQIGRLRTTTLRTLSKVISMSSYDHFPSVAETAAVSQLCTKAVTQHRGVEMLLSIICGGPHISEEAKIAAVECILVLVVRNDSGKQAIVETPGGLQHLGTALQAERSPMVRNYTATCVRELANTHPSYIVQSGFPELVVGIVRGDSSADVRECALRTLDIVFKSDSSYAGRYPLKPELAEVLHGLLEGDNNRDVTENACRLLSTLFSLEGRNATRTEHDAVFTAAWVDREAYRTLLKVAAGRSGSQVAGFAARAFRHLVQHCPWQLQFGHKLIENWESVDCLLLKALQPTSAPKPDDKETQIPLVELSISTALLFAQSPYTRSAIHRELSGFPAYLPALRSHIIGSLEIPTLEYYAGIDLFDVTGTHVNDMQGIQWNVNDKGTHVPTPSSVRQVFVQQDQRVAEQARSGATGAAGGGRGGAFPAASTSYDEPDVQRQKEMRLTFILCTYAVHLALSPGPAAAAAAGGVAAAPAGGAAAALASSASSSSSASDTRDASSSPRDAAAAAAAAAAAGGGYPMRYPSQHSTVHGDGAAPAHHQEQHPAYFPGDSGHHQQPPLPQNALSYPGMGSSVGAPPPQMWQGGPPPPGDVGGGSPVGPAPTRASIMREHNAHPDRAQAALLRQMRQQQQQPPPQQPQPHPADPQYPNETMQSYNMPSQIDPRGSQIMHGHPNHTASLSYSIGPPGGYAFQPEQASAARSLGGRGGPPGPPAFQHEPMFPTAGRPSPSAAVPRARVNPELRQTYSKFDQALKLTIHFAQYFNRKVETKPTYKATPDGFMVRQTHIANPWTPVVKKAKLKTWTVKDLKEGDLFYFAIPFNEICADLVEGVLAKARKHSTNAKKLFLITPQRAKGRRWFLFDLLNNIIPRVQDVLLELVRLLHDHGEENTKFPLFMFREQEMQEGERAVHPGNLMDIVDQIKFYFSQSPNDLVGVNTAYIKDLDERMKALSAREFTGYEDDISSSSSSSLSSDDKEDLAAMAGLMSTQQQGSRGFAAPPASGGAPASSSLGGGAGPMPPMPAGGVGGGGRPSALAGPVAGVGMDDDSDSSSDVSD